MHIQYFIVPDFVNAAIVVEKIPKAKVIYLQELLSDNVKVLEHIEGETYRMSNLFINHLVELQNVYESLTDEESKKVFRGYWLGRIGRQFNEFVFSNGSHYMTEGFIPESGAVVIDGGACDGTTALMFKEFGCEVYGFELDKVNFESAKKLAEKNNFVMENFGLGSYEHEMTYTSAPGGNIGASRIDINGSETAKITTIDSYVREKGFSKVDCIKLDVEGAELDVLKGASTTIKRWKPILFLSAYHKWDDFWTLMNFVKSIRSDYQWALRHYATTYDDDRRKFQDGNLGKLLASLNMDMTVKTYCECCLLAR